MKNNNTQLEQALFMYKETVSPHEDNLRKILSQLPERETTPQGRAIRSPYTWVAIMQVITLSMILLLVYPTLSASISSSNFYTVDNQIDVFDVGLNNSDIEDMRVNYNNL